MSRKVEQLPEGSFSTAQAAMLAGVKPANLQYWCDQNIVVPSIRKPDGSGGRREYSLQDVYRIRFVKQLRDYKVSLRRIRDAVIVADEIIASPDQYQHAIVVRDRGSVLVIVKSRSTERLIIDAIAKGRQLALEVVLDTLQEETLARVANSK